MTARAPLRTGDCRFPGAIRLRLPGFDLVARSQEFVDDLARTEVEEAWRTPAIERVVRSSHPA